MKTKTADLDLRHKYIVERIDITRAFPGELALNEEYNRLERKSSFNVTVYFYPPFVSASEKADFYYEAEVIIELKIQDAIEEYIRKYFQGAQPEILIEKLIPMFLKMVDTKLGSMQFKVGVLELEFF